MPDSVSPFMSAMSAAWRPARAIAVAAAVLALAAAALLSPGSDSDVARADPANIPDALCGGVETASDKAEAAIVTSAAPVAARTA